MTGKHESKSLDMKCIKLYKYSNGNNNNNKNDKQGRETELMISGALTLWIWLRKEHNYYNHQFHQLCQK